MRTSTLVLTMKKHKEPSNRSASKQPEQAEAHAKNIRKGLHGARKLPHAPIIAQTHDFQYMRHVFLEVFSLGMSWYEEIFLAVVASIKLTIPATLMLQSMASSAVVLS